MRDVHQHMHTTSTRTCISCPSATLGHHPYRTNFYVHALSALQFIGIPSGPIFPPAELHPPPRRKSTRLYPPLPRVDFKQT